MGFHLACEHCWDYPCTCRSESAKRIAQEWRTFEAAAPQQGERVLVWNGWPLIVEYRPTLRPGWRWMLEHNLWLTNEEVTHWMPLPTGPK